VREPVVAVTGAGVGNRSGPGVADTVAVPVISCTDGVVMPAVAVMSAPRVGSGDAPVAVLVGDGVEVAPVL
jgi:hypothetical protein